MLETYKVPRAQRGHFLGRSKTHALNIGLIRNLKTGRISTQYHVVYGDYFTTIASNNENIALEDTWNHLFQFISENLVNDVNETP